MADYNVEKKPSFHSDRKVAERDVLRLSTTEYGEIVTTQDGEVAENTDQLHRRLNNRQIQLIAIGGSIGTALFVSIGTGLSRGGPGSLFLAYAIYSCFLAMVGNGTAEMTTLFPVSGGFVRLAGHFVDEAWGFMAGWNFFLYEGLIIPFEITALTTVLGYWSDNIPPWSVPIACIFLYGLINILAVRAYGEAEFWLSGGKVILIPMLFCFTFITMVCYATGCYLDETELIMFRSAGTRSTIHTAFDTGAIRVPLRSTGPQAPLGASKAFWPAFGQHPFVSRYYQPSYTLDADAQI
jgi:amino acid transporter